MVDKEISETKTVSTDLFFVKKNHFTSIWLQKAAASHLWEEFTGMVCSTLLQLELNTKEHEKEQEIKYM